MSMQGWPTWRDTRPSYRPQGSKNALDDANTTQVRRYARSLGYLPILSPLTDCLRAKVHLSKLANADLHAL